MVKRLIMDNANVSHFERFQFLLRFEFHDLVHCVIDGTMCTPDSASAPEFFLHHGFVDKIWWVGKDKAVVICLMSTSCLKHSACLGLGTDRTISLI